MGEVGEDCEVPEMPKYQFDHWEEEALYDDRNALHSREPNEQSGALTLR